MKRRALVFCFLVTTLSACGPSTEPTDTEPTEREPLPPPDQVIMVDEAHNNGHRLNGTFSIFAELARSLGYTVIPSRTPFRRDSLDRGRILTIANALHVRNANGDWSLPTPSAFTSQEIQVVRDWVEAGGSLLLIADHMPFPGAAEDLAAVFGVRFNNGFAFDTLRLRAPVTCLRGNQIQVFRRSDGSLRDHVITNGRNAAERVDSVATFTGQAFAPDTLTGPLMVFGPSAVSLMPEVAWSFPSGTPRISVDGWPQGAVRRYGEGRIAFFGEAAMFTEQVCGSDNSPMGMNAPQASQNAQFALNLIRWLGGKL